VSAPLVWTLAWAHARTVALLAALEAGHSEYAQKLAAELDAALARCGRPA
jgi:hypothetical protein